MIEGDDACLADGAVGCLLRRGSIPVRALIGLESAKINGRGEGGASVK